MPRGSPPAADTWQIACAATLRLHMRAITYSRYGSPDVLGERDVATPVAKDDEVLIHVRATTVTSGDWRARSLTMPAGFAMFARPFFGFSGPRRQILGTELAGDVVAIGRLVTKFNVGDAVFAFPGARMGGYAEYCCMPESGSLALKPANLGYEKAAALSFGGTTALSFFRKGDLQQNDRVLINGASGGVGTAAVQIAKHCGAHVTAVCGPRNLDMVRSLGASEVIDYTKEDFTQNGKSYDIIVDTAGTAPFSRSKRSLKKGGRLLLVLASLRDVLASPFAAFSGKHVVAGPVTVLPDDMRLLAALAEAGELRPVIDQTYGVEGMADAHRHVDAGHKRGNIVVKLWPIPIQAVEA